MAMELLGFEFSGPRCLQAWSCARDARSALVFEECAAMWWRRRGRGEVPEIGGGKTRGKTMSGIWRFVFCPRSKREWMLPLPDCHGSEVRMQARGEPPKAACTAFFTIRSARDGLCEGCTIDVYRTSCALRLQFSRRRFDTGRISRRVRGAPDARHGFAGPRRRVRRAAFSSGREENWSAGAHRCGSDVGERLALSIACRIARGVPESVPVDYADEAAREKRGRACLPGRNRRKSGRPDLHHGRKRGSSGACAGEKRNRRRDGMRSAALRDFRAAKCVRGIAAALLSQRRGTQPGGY